MSIFPSSAHLLAFEAVARRRSFALAAQELHVTASAISHQITRLEAQVGVRLFERSAHGVALSRAGAHYLQRISGALEAIAAATEELRRKLGNSLHVNCAPSLASLWLMPRLRDFARTHPDISLSLRASHVYSDFAFDQFDVDIRYGVPQWPNLEVELLFEESIAPLASPSFIAEHGLTQPEQLLTIPLIQSNVSIVQWPDWFAAYCPRLRAPTHFAIRFDRAQMSLDAATQGLGVALESTMNAAGHIARGELIAPFGLDKVNRVKGHFAVYPARNAHRSAVQAFLTWLHQEAAQSAQQAQG